MHQRHSIKSAVLFFIMLSFLWNAGFSLQRTRLSFVHLSDLHGYLETQDRKEFAGIGGVTYLYDYMQFYRKDLLKRGIEVWTVNSGDIFQKSAYGIIFKGKASMSIMNLFPIDFTVPGNHELSVDVEYFRDLPKKMSSEVLCANARMNDAGKTRILTPYSVRKVNGVRCFMIGLITPQTNFLMSPRIEDRVLVTELEPELDSIFSKENIGSSDIVILLTHCEFEENERIARKYHGTVDLIFGGHDHEVICEKVKGIPIIHSGAYGYGFSVVSAEFDNGCLVRSDAEYIKVGNRTIAEELGKWKKELTARTSETIVDNPVELSASGNGSELNPLSYHVAEVIRKYSESSDIGMINSGGVREEIPAGKVTIRDLIEVFPYDNYIVKLEIDGKLLKELVKVTVDNMATSKGILHFSGIEVLVHRDRSFQVFRNGREVLDDDKMTFATSDFLTNGGDELHMLKNFKLKRYTLIRDALLEEVRTAFPFPAMPEWLKTETK